jgi:hypothetical protein
VAAGTPDRFPPRPPGNGQDGELDLPSAVCKIPRPSALLLSFFLLLLGVGVSSTWGQPARSARLSSVDLTSTVQIDELDPAARVHLERVQQFLDAGQWNEAVATLRRVMESDGRRLIAVPDAGDRPLVRHVPVLRYCQGVLSRWHASAPQALEQYRREINAAARRVWDEALAEGNESQAREVVEQFFVSSVGDDALLLLGEFALERGEYTRARHYWEQLHPRLRSAPGEGSGQAGARPLAPGRPRWLAWLDRAPGASFTPAAAPSSSSAAWISFPDSDLPLADIQARLVYVSLLEGNWQRAEIELELLRQSAPDARGTILGREGGYVELLEALAEEARGWRRPPASEAATFGSMSQRIPQFSPGEAGSEDDAGLDFRGPPVWRVRLPRVTAERDVLSQRRPRTAESDAGCLSYHPLVVNSAVFVAQSGSIRAFDLVTGKPLIASDTGDAGSEDAAMSTWTGTIYRRDVPEPDWRGEQGSHWGVPRYTLTATPRWLFARMGAPVTRWRNFESPWREVRSHLIGVDLESEGRLLPGYPRYADDAQWSFEGAPLVEGSRLYVAMRRQDEIRVESHVACFEALSGRLLWRRQICTAETPGEGLVHELTHSLVTLDQGTLYFNTHLGAVAAMEAATGNLRWLVTYPRAAYPPHDGDDALLHPFRDLTPAIVARGVVVCAPSDCRQIFALDAASGQRLWALPVDFCTDVKHLLGVSEDCLLASGNYLYWIDLDRGSPRTQFPAPRRQASGFAMAEPRGYGRGWLEGQRVYWPTRDHIFIFGTQPRVGPGGWLPVMTRAPIDLQLHQAAGGNLVVASGMLLIATADELLAFWAGGPGGNH